MVPKVFADWTLVIPTPEALTLYHQGKVTKLSYMDETQNNYKNLKLIHTNPSKDKVLYTNNFASSSYDGPMTYQGDFYLLDTKEGLINLGGYNGTYSLSPNGNLGVFGNQSLVISNDLSQYTQSPISIPRVNSEIIWNEDSSQVWFSAHSAPYGTELFSYTINADLGLEGGLVKDVSPGSASGIHDYYFEKGFALLPNGNAIFYAGDSTYWLSDGTEENTQPLYFLDHYNLNHPVSSPISTFQDKAVLSGTTRNSDSQYTSSLIMTNGDEQGLCLLN